MPFVFDWAPDARARRTIAAGVAASIAVLLLAFVVLPTMSQWRDREAIIDAMRRQAGQLRSLGTHGERLVADARAREAAADALPVRLLRGRTVALVASQLQSLLQEYASASRVSVTRLDVASSGDSASAASGEIPATISAVSDVYGLADFLVRLEHGRRLLDVSELSVGANSALRGELLQMSIVVRAPYVLTP